jgi:iron-sulfur cluster assembly accessory protein
MARRTLQVQEKATEQVFSLTPTAVAKVRELAAVEPGQVALRLVVQPGGCAGFKYGLFFDDEVAPGDIVEEIDGVRVVCDPMSAPHVQGVVIDWAETLQKSGFVIENPNVRSSCACGDSFQ